MDPNLQQFPDKDRYNPWVMSWSFSVGLLIGVFFLLKYGPENIQLTVAGVIVSLILITIILAALMIDEKLSNYGLTMLFPPPDRARYFKLNKGQLEALKPGRYREKAQKELLYIFDGMVIRRSFIDCEGIRHEIVFRVYFYQGPLAWQDFSFFFSWYKELDDLIPYTKAVLAHLTKLNGSESTSFKIKFPYNPPLYEQS